MSGLGFVRSELEIKTLTLFVLDYINQPVSFEELMKMAFVDDAMNYFNFADHLQSMISTGHIELSSDTGIDKYSITPKGVRDLNAIRSSVPASVLKKAENACDDVREEIARQNLVKVKIVEEGDSFRALCSISDESGEFFEFSMSAESKASARQITSGFYNNAEKLYNNFLASILNPED